MKKTALFLAFVATFISASAQSFFKADTLAIKELKVLHHKALCGSPEMEESVAKWDYHTMQMVRKAGNLSEALTAMKWARIHPDNPTWLSAISKVKYLAFQQIAEAKTPQEIDQVLELCKSFGLDSLGNDYAVASIREKLWLKEQEEIIDARNK